MLIISLLAAAAAAGTPTYLRCTFPSNGVEVMMTADEANSAVTISLPSTGFIEKVPASFTADAVRFRGSMTAYVLSRTDLTVQRSIPAINSTDAGTCKVEDAPKRAF